MIRLPVTELWSAEVGEVMNLTSSKIYKPRIPDIAESVFDILYLVFDLLAGIIFLLKADGKVLFILYALLTFVLCGGDAFHIDRCGGGCRCALQRDPHPQRRKVGDYSRHFYYLLSKRKMQ